RDFGAETGNYTVVSNFEVDCVDPSVEEICRDAKWVPSVELKGTGRTGRVAVDENIEPDVICRPFSRDKSRGRIQPGQIEGSAKGSGNIYRESGGGLPYPF